MDTVTGTFTQQRHSHEPQENFDKPLICNQRNINPRHIRTDDVKAHADQRRMCLIIGGLHICTHTLTHADHRHMCLIIGGLHICIYTHAHSNTDTHTYPIRMFRVKQRRHWLISKLSFSRHCVVLIRDTCSQLTWKSHSPHTHRGTFWPNLTTAQSLYLHESRQNKSKSKCVKQQRRLLIFASPVHRSYSWYMQPVDTKLTFTRTQIINNTHTHTHTSL